MKKYLFMLAAALSVVGCAEHRREANYENSSDGTRVRSAVQDNAPATDAVAPPSSRSTSDATTNSSATDASRNQNNQSAPTQNQNQGNNQGNNTNPGNP